MLFKRSNAAGAAYLISEVLDALDDLVVVTRGKNCEILYLNAAARNILALEQMGSEGCRDSFSALIPSLCRQCANQSGDSGGPDQRFEVFDGTGHAYAVTSRMIEWTDESPATLLLLKDIQESRAAEKQLRNLAYLDQLTLIPNRTKLKEDYARICNQGDCQGALAIFDIDNFKAINDAYGHNTGDMMLRRLVNHLNQLPAFSGHLYRLGGDEFVLLYMEKEDRFQSEEDFREYYGQLLQGAFCSYTMPHIDLFCNISMGAAFFPLHGIIFSELLRKADIALYQAKKAGRNQLVFFEDKYDNAKKFEDYYITICPILTAGDKTFGYELMESIRKGTGSSLSLGDYDRAIDALELRNLEDNFRYVITYSDKLNYKAVLNYLPRNKFIIQIPLSSAVTPDQLTICRRLQRYGYSLMMDGLTEDNWTDELLQVAEFFKLAPGLSEETLLRLAGKAPQKTLVAAGVETREAMEQARKAGATLFQGRYFSRAVIRKEKDVSPLKANYLRLLRLTSTDDYVDFSKITQVISSDVALSYKLLKLLNSVAVGLRNRMSSIPMAVSYLGEESLKKWIALLALRGVTQDNPLELIRLSLIRARFGELLAPHLMPHRDEKYVFLTGMFSLLHIALEISKEELMEIVPMAEGIRLSLTTKEGIYSDLIEFFSHYEYGNWEEVTRFTEQNGLTSEKVYDAYIASVQWYNNLVGP